MGLRKESDKELRMDKKESSFRKESAEKIQDKENFKGSTNTNKNKGFSNFEAQSNKNVEMEKNESPLRKTSDKKADGEQGVKDYAKGSITKGFDSYREELEDDDYGLEATNKMSDQGIKITKKSVASAKEIKDVYKNRSQYNQLKKADEEHFKSVKEKLGKEQKSKQQKAPVKLKKDEQKAFDLSKENNANGKTGFLKKVINQPKNIGVSAKNKGIESYKEALESDDDGVKTGAEGIKLVKSGTKSISQANKKRKKQGSVKKLKGHSTKLQTEGKLRKASLNTSTKKGQKALQKKKIVRNSIYQKRGKASATLSTLTKNTSMQVKAGTKAIKRVIAVAFKKVIGTKALGVLGAISIKLLPVFAVVGIVMGIIIIIMAMASGGVGEDERTRNIGFETIDPEVEQWRELVTEIAEANDMTDYIGLILAIIQVESGGTGTRDIMQSSESAGYPRNYFQTERESVEQGISYLKSAVERLEGYSSDYLNDMKLIAQSYNFGIGFAGHVGSNDYDGYDITISENYSKDVVAVSLGNLTGETYPYENELSLRLNKPYLYRNGGNFLYGELIGQYINAVGDGELYPPVQPLRVTSLFGPRPSPGGIGSTDHKGIDFGCTLGVTPINALAGGTVVKSQYMNGLGNTVIVQHNNSMYTTYGHMNSLSVQTGQTVNAGEQLGICGTTGNSTGPHLHLELSPQPHQNQVDPYPYIQHLIGG